MRGVAALAVATFALAATTNAAVARTGVAPCRGAALRASFSVVPGSAGAGNIVYILRARNRTTRTCFVSGLPRLGLLSRTGAALPTHPFPEHLGALTAVQVVLRPGAYASANARFTPDVPGPGEQTNGPCEPVATRLRVTPQPGGGTIIAAVVPPTRVCVHGRMTVSGFVAGRNGALAR